MPTHFFSDASVIGPPPSADGGRGARDAGETPPVTDASSPPPPTTPDAVGVEFQQERAQPEQRPHQQHAAVAVLDVGGVDDRLHQQALGVDQDVALLALDLLAGVVARRVDAAPPFSAPLTLWLSMIAAVGLASRPACSRHSTWSAWWMRSSVRSASQRRR